MHALTSISFPLFRPPHCSGLIGLTLQVIYVWTCWSKFTPLNNDQIVSTNWLFSISSSPLIPLHHASDGSGREWFTQQSGDRASCGGAGLRLTTDSRQFCRDNSTLANPANRVHLAFAYTVRTHSIIITINIIIIVIYHTTFSNALTCKVVTRNSFRVRDEGLWKIQISSA